MSVKIKQVQGLTSVLNAKAPLVSPIFTGTPAAPTATATDNSTTIATTAFVKSLAAIATPGMDGVGAVGTSTLYARQDHIHPSDTSRAPLASPAFTGTPTAPTPTVTDNSTTIATTAFVKAQVVAAQTITITGDASGSGTNSINLTLADVNASTATYGSANSVAVVHANSKGLVTLISEALITPAAIGAAPLASPALTGTPTAPTPTVTDNSTTIATTAFVKAQGYALDSGVVHLAGTETITGTKTFSVSPVIPTVTATDSSTLAASTAFVKSLAASVNPLMDGTVAIGTSTFYARQDHVHPTDTTRAPLASPAFTGTPTAPTPTATDNSTNLATTAWVHNAIQGTQTLWIPAAAIVPRRSNGCSNLTKTEITASQPNINSLNFSKTSQQYAQFNVAFPKAWNLSNIFFEVFWTHPSTTTNFGVVWSLAAVALSASDLIGTNFGTAITATSTGGTTFAQYTTGVSSALTVAGTPAVDDISWFEISRVTGNASDTLAVSAYLLGVKIYYITNALNDN